ncbi:hypothetical protein FIV07_28000 (plasmid) [Mycobacterium sp. THAF192]|nr:hypothetical protein FIV07_28000 [Mycobacterium sp. THAF192]
MAGPSGQPDHVVSIPDGAQFFRVADEAGSGSDLIEPVAAYAAKHGDVVVLSGERVGTYLGGGRVLLGFDESDGR